MIDFSKAFKHPDRLSFTDRIGLTVAVLFYLVAPLAVFALSLLVPALRGGK